MFKKLLSNLPFNPSLISQVSFYAKRLKAESSVRRLGVAFLVLALGVQIFAAAVPSEPTLARSGNDIIPGGFSSQGDAVNMCQSNAYSFKQILAHFGIDCLALYYGQVVTVGSNDYGGQLYSMGREPQGFPGEVNVNVPGVADTLHMRPLSAWGSTSYRAIKGNASDGSTFFILFDCGNLVTVGPPATPPPPPPPPPLGVKCSNLAMSVPNNSQVKVGATVSLRGQAVGSNVKPNTQVSMYYRMIDAKTGAVVEEKHGEGLKFNGTTVQDTVNRPFTITKEGTYTFKLAVRYDGGAKLADGSNEGNCMKQVKVVKQPCIVNENPDVCITQNKSVKNDSQGSADANGTTVKPGDLITYTLTVRNITKDKAVKNYVVEDNISDSLEYADVVNLHGGTISDTKVVRWPAVNIGAGKAIEKQITLRVKNPIPNTPASTSNPDSYDCVMTNVFGDVTRVNLPCSTVKNIEQVSGEIPNTGPGETIAVAALVVTAAGYFFARSRLMSKELDIVRAEYAKSGSN